MVGGRLSAFVAFVQLVAQTAQMDCLDFGLRGGRIEIIEVEVGH